MTRLYWSWRMAALAFAVTAHPAIAAGPAPPGGVWGFVEDTRGAPLAGAVISFFGRGVGGSGLTTLSDSAGRFLIPSLPAGSYTVRALRDGHRPAAARRLIVLPNQDATFTVSLTPLGEASASEAEAKRKKEEEADAERELHWLLRHKRRSVLEARGTLPAPEKAAPGEARLLASLLPSLDASLEVMTSPTLVGMGRSDALDGESVSSSVVRLKGRLAESARWTLAGVVAERETLSWRMAGEFFFEPGGGHEIQAATGYGTRILKPGASYDARLDRGVGALFLQDRWEFGDRMATTVGGRFSYVGFLPDPNSFDPIASLELRPDEHTRVRGTMAVRGLVPGGDVLTLTRLSTTPGAPFTMPEQGLRRERIRRYEVAVDQDFGRTTLAAYTFFEGVRDQLVNSFDGPGALTMQVTNGGNASAHGMGLTLSRRFGDIFTGSMSYVYGQSRRDTVLPDRAALAYREGDFHDVAARLETFIAGTDTRLVAFYRVNQVIPPHGFGGAATGLRNTRFEFQLSQGLPLLGTITGADWDLLVAVRNLFYEPYEGAVLDEMTVSNPPRRVLGGISVRF